MDKENKRYVVTMDMYVYADNDYMARKRAHTLAKSIDQKADNSRVAVTELGEQPFASLDYRKIDDHSEPVSSKYVDEDLAF